MPPPKSCHKTAESFAKCKYSLLMICDCTHQHCSVQSLPVHLNILPKKRRPHTVPHHKIGHIRIFLLRTLPERMNISENAYVSVFFIEKSIF